MYIKHGQAQESETVDVTGLPEPIIQSIKQVVESIRDPNNLKWVARIELSADPSRDVNENSRRSLGKVPRQS